MTNHIKTIAATFAALAFAGAAIAQEDVNTAFSIDPTASVEENYDSIRKTAAQACDEMHPRQETSFNTAYNRVKKGCRAQLIDTAVLAFADPYITALHEDREVAPRVFASKD